MISEAETPILPLTESTDGQQLEIPDIDTDRDDLYQRMIGTINRINLRLGRAHSEARFSYQEVVAFAASRQKTAQEAGKMFTRFYQGLQALDLEPPKSYEHNRDGMAFPLSLLSAVISQMPENQDDTYDKLLRSYYTKKMGHLLVKESTSA